MDCATRRPFADVPPDAVPYAVRMRDGIRLATDVYLPTRGARWPVLLSRLPYDKAGDECFMPSIARWFTERGYAVVVQDVRGKVRSDGDLQPFRHEQQDGYDTLDWITRQSWAEASVGMFGDSYFGWTQWAAAASGHPALHALTPRVISSSFDDVVTRQGVFAQEVCTLWALETWVDEALYDFEGQLDWSIRPASDVVTSALGGRRSPFLDDLAGGSVDAASRLRVRHDLPALHLGGFWDFGHRGQIATWRQARLAGHAPQFLWMDSVDHGWNYLREPGQPFVDPRADETTMAAFLELYLGPLLPFLDRFVKGDGAYDEPPVRWKLTHDGWRDGDTWPPRDSDRVEWFLARRPDHQGGAGGAGGAGGLVTRADDAQSVVSWAHDPDRPVPSRGHAYHPLIDPVDEAAGESREDVLVFETDAFRRQVDLAGPAELKVWLRSSSPSTHLMASVSDLAPDGSAFRVLDGALLASTGELGLAVVDLGSTGYRVRPGHRLRLELSSSEFPRYVLHPGSDADPWTARTTQTTEQQILVGGPRGARLRCFVLRDHGGAS